MGSLIEDLLSGQSIQPRQPSQAPMDIGSLMSFISQNGSGQIPQLQAPQLGGHNIDINSILQMFHTFKQHTDKSKAQEYMKQLLGTPGQERIPTPLKNARDAIPGSGMLGGKMTLPEFAAGLVGSPDEAAQAAGFQMYQDMAKPHTRTSPAIHSMGAPGKDGYKVNFYLDENNQPVPVGEPYKEGAGVTINTGNADGVQRILTPEEKKAKGFNASSVVGVDSKGEMKVLQQPTEAQGKDAGRSIMQNNSDKQYKQLLKDGYDPTAITTDIALQPGLDATGIIGPGIATLARKYMDPKAVRYNQIQDTWIETFGRDQSGGAIKPEEYPAWRKMYWPQQGDDAETVKNKDESRKAYEASLKARAGEDAILKSSQPIEKSISKSGKPIIKVNGVWEYE